MAEVKDLLFGDGLMSPTLTGDKKITIRKYRAGSHDFIKGEVVQGIFKDGLNILLCITADTEKKPFSDLADEEARSDGFKDVEDAFNGLRHHYSDFQRSDMVAIIRYEILKINSVQVVSINEHAG